MSQHEDNEQREMVPDDADYSIPVENKGYVHTLALVALVVLPVAMIVSLILQSGFMALFNVRVLIIIPIIAVMYFIARYTRDLGSVSVASIEKQYDNIIIVEPTELSSDDVKRPKRISVHTTDGTMVPFSFITRYDYTKHYTTDNHDGMIVVKNGKAAILVEDVNE